MPAVDGDEGREADGRLTEIAENLHRREISQIERAGLVAEWVRIVDERKGAQVAHLKPPGAGRGSTGGKSEAARKLGNGMNSALAKYIQKPARATAEADPAAEPAHPAHDAAFMQESERIFGNETGMRQGFENKRARLKRQLLLGTANRPMDMEQARMAALEALEKFDQASDELGMAVAWTSVLRDHLLAERGEKTTQDDDLL